MAAYTINLKKTSGGFEAFIPQFSILLFAPSLELAYNLACAAFQTCFLAMQENNEKLPSPEPDIDVPADTFHMLFHFPPRHHASYDLVWHPLPPSLIAFCDQPHANWLDEITAFASAHANDPSFNLTW